MAYNTTVFLNRLICTNCVGFGKSQDRVERFSWSKNDSNDLDVKLKVFKKDDKKDFRLVQNHTMGDAYFNQFMRLKNQLINAVQNFPGKEKLSQSWYLYVQKLGWTLKLAHKLFDVVEPANKGICVTLLH